MSRYQTPFGSVVNDFEALARDMLDPCDARELIDFLLNGAMVYPLLEKDGSRSLVTLHPVREKGRIVSFSVCDARLLKKDSHD